MLINKAIKCGLTALLVLGVGVAAQAQTEVLVDGDFTANTAWSTWTNGTTPVTPNLAYSGGPGTDPQCQIGGSATGESGVWQVVNFTAGMQYDFTGLLQGDALATADTWAEVIIGNVEPVNGEPYSSFATPEKIVQYVGLFNTYNGHLGPATGYVDLTPYTANTTQALWVLVKAGSNAANGTYVVDNLSLIESTPTVVWDAPPTPMKSTSKPTRSTTTAA